MFCYFVSLRLLCSFFFFNDTATTEIYTLSLHDALPIYPQGGGDLPRYPGPRGVYRDARARGAGKDRKSTRLNSSHGYISYAVFCLKKKKTPSSCCHSTTDTRTIDSHDMCTT